MPKARPGALDLLTRTITDGGMEFDRMQTGYSGPLYAEICPRSFSVLVRPGMRLNQIRFRLGHAVLSDDALPICTRKAPLVDGDAVIEDGLGLLCGPQSASDNAGGLSRQTAYRGDRSWIRLVTMIQLTIGKRSHEHRQIILDPGAFYISGQPRGRARSRRTMRPRWPPILAMVGEFRVHYAGFFDPGFGHAAARRHGQRGVLEVRCHEAPFVLEHGQVVGRLVYEAMLETPSQLYGREIASNYQGQGLKLSKHFK